MAKLQDEAVNSYSKAMNDFSVHHLVVAYSRSHCRDLDQDERREYAKLYDALAVSLGFDLEADVTTEFGRSAVQILHHQKQEKELGANIDTVSHTIEEALAVHLEKMYQDECGKMVSQDEIISQGVDARLLDAV